MKRQNFSSKSAEIQHLSRKQVIFLVLCGAVVGFVNGFFGGGGGLICVPLIERILHLNAKYSHSTTIAIIFPVSFISACIYSFGNSIPLQLFSCVGAGTLLGGIIGAFLMKFISEKWLKIIFVFLMFASGIRMLF